MAREKTTNFPTVPFDGQEFIDAYRIKWQYDSSTKCWRRIGAVPEIPLATETQMGLLSAKQKELLDSIPEKGGHFGIIAKPLLGLVPRDLPTELSDKVYGAVLNESGSSIQGLKPRRGEQYISGTYDGKFLRFTKGTLKDRTFLIYTNDAESILVQGDASGASYEDEFVVFDPLTANEHGVVMGDVEIKSDTIDITCVDSNNDPMNFSNDCGLDYKDNDGGPQSPGLDLKISDKVLDSFCVELRPCKGPKGDKGPKGLTGADGTGDGPTGEMGDPGQDAPSVGHTFSGIKFVESNDVYDSAIVGLELNPDEGKINVIKAKMIVPDDDTPATQLITTPLDRSLEWTDNEFAYNLLKPANDPIEVRETGDADVTLGAYHKDYEIVTEGLPEDIEASRIATLNKVQLSELLDKAIEYFRTRLEDIEEGYNKDIKKFIEEKDSAARAILASLAQQVAECEWQMPVEYCLLPGTQITMANGAGKNVENIDVGDKVLGSDGMPHKVSKTMNRHVFEHITALDCSGTGRELKLTNNHPVMVGKFDQTRKIGHGRRKNYRSDLSLEDYEWVLPNEIEKNDIVMAPLPKFRTSSMTCEEAEFLGYYAAEGDCKKYCVRFSLGKHEHDFADRIIELGIALGASSAKKFNNHSESALTVYVYGRQIAEACKSHIGCGARNKTLSKTIMGLNKELALTFVRAFFLGDGAVGKHGATGIRAQTTLASISLIDQLYWILASHGIPSTKWFGMSPGGPHNRELTRIRGHLNLSKNAVYEIWPHMVDKKSRVPQSHAIINDHIAIRVKNVESEFYDGLVYNIEVDDNHCYIANGVVVHNCVGITPDVCHEGGEGGGPGGGGGGGGGGGSSASNNPPTPTPWPNPIPRFPTPDSIPTPVPVPVPPSTVTPGPGGSGTPIVTITEETPPYPQTTPTASTTPQPSPWVLTTFLVSFFGSPFVPENAAVAFTYNSGAIRTASSAWEVPLFATGIVGGTSQTISTSFAAVNDYDPHDLNSVEKAYKRGDPNSGLPNDGRTFLVGEYSQVNQIYLTLRTKGPIMEGTIYVNVDIIYDRNNPPKGVPITSTAPVTPGKSDDPIITAVSPNTVPVGVPTPITIYLGSDGAPAQTGATIEIQGPTPATWATDTIEDRTITGEVFITPLGPFPAPQDYDVLIVNPDGSNGIGTSVITSQ